MTAYVVDERGGHFENMARMARLPLTYFRDLRIDLPQAFQGNVAGHLVSALNINVGVTRTGFHLNFGNEKNWRIKSVVLDFSSATFETIIERFQEIRQRNVTSRFYPLYAEAMGLPVRGVMEPVDYPAEDQGALALVQLVNAELAKQGIQEPQSEYEAMKRELAIVGLVKLFADGPNCCRPADQNEWPDTYPYRAFRAVMEAQPA